MNVGTVKQFEGGYGFIVPDDGGPIVFVFWKEIDMEGFKSLEVGQRVAYELSKSTNGYKNRAVNVRILEDPY